MKTIARRVLLGLAASIVVVGSFLLVFVVGVVLDWYTTTMSRILMPSVGATWTSAITCVVTPVAILVGILVGFLVDPVSHWAEVLDSFAGKQ